jgi:hypothetical protein
LNEKRRKTKRQRKRQIIKAPEYGALQTLRECGVAVQLNSKRGFG